mmetsp:Transcript_51577/g.117297  ORF Transcript_51577/g.117297 Transcript_51577/m.117297 type:complete len:212 (+) Transcript_51577:177-812(+)
MVPGSLRVLDLFLLFPGTNGPFVGAPRLQLLLGPEPGHGLFPCLVLILSPTRTHGLKLSPATNRIAAALPPTPQSPRTLHLARHLPPQRHHLARAVQCQLLPPPRPRPRPPLLRPARPRRQPPPFYHLHPFPPELPPSSPQHLCSPSGDPARHPMKLTETISWALAGWHATTQGAAASEGRRRQRVWRRPGRNWSRRPRALATQPWCSMVG